MAENGNVIDFASGRTLSGAEVEDVIEKYGAVDDGIGWDFRAMIDSIAPTAARLVGTHRGVLAGLSEAERDKAIDTYLLNDILDGSEFESADQPEGLSDAEAFDGEVEGAPADGAALDQDIADGAPEPDDLSDLFANLDPAKILLEGCEVGPVRTKLSQLLLNAPMDWLRDCSADFGLGDFVTTSKKKMASRLANMMSASAAHLTQGLGGLTETVLTGIRRVLDAGGSLTIADDDVTVDGISDVPVPVPPYLFCFHADAADDAPASFTFVIPEELVGLMNSVDWQEVLHPAAQRAVLAKYIEASVSMRGIVAQSVLEECYLADVPDPIAAEDLLMSLPMVVRDGQSGILVLLPENDEAYLLAEQIGQRYIAEHPELEVGVDDILIEGELDDTLEELLARQDEYEPAPVTADLLAAPNYYEWAALLPGAVALRTFVDEHIPDGDDDYCFADSFVESVQMLSHTSFTPEEYRLFIERMYPVDDIDVLTRAWELALECAAETPRWDLNGWTPLQAEDLVESED